MKYQVLTQIIEKEILNENTVSFTLFCPEIACQSKPGQFIHVKCGREDTLRRPISICETTKDTVRIVFQIKGSGTQWLSRREIGTSLSILGPLGNGYELESFSRILLVGGGIGVAPLLSIAQKNENCDSILGYKDRNSVILNEEFESLCKNTVIMTDDGSFREKGFVTDGMKKLLSENKYDCVCACGPLAMLKNVSDLSKENNISCFVSLEERMGCGVGACLTCAVLIKRDNVTDYLRVCKDGPVFNSNEVLFDG